MPTKPHTAWEKIGHLLHLSYRNREFKKSGTAPLIGERAQTDVRGRPRGRLGSVGSGMGRVRGRPRGRLGLFGSLLLYTRFGVTQGAGAT